MINNLGNSDEFDELFEAYLSMGKINWREVKLVRNTAASVDLIPAASVRKEQYTGETVYVKLPLENTLRKIPVVKVNLELRDNTKVVKEVAENDLDMNYYLSVKYWVLFSNKIKIKPQGGKNCVEQKPVRRRHL